ncbi:hypothetical protein V8E55_004311 [Tylopilus felleus]
MNSSAIRGREPWQGHKRGHTILASSNDETIYLSIIYFPVPVSARRVHAVHVSATADHQISGGRAGGREITMRAPTTADRSLISTKLAPSLTSLVNQQPNVSEFRSRPQVETILQLSKSVSPPLCCSDVVPCPPVASCYPSRYRAGAPESPLVPSVRGPRKRLPPCIARSISILPESRPVHLSYVRYATVIPIPFWSGSRGVMGRPCGC